MGKEYIFLIESQYIYAYISQRFINLSNQKHDIKIYTKKWETRKYTCTNERHQTYKQNIQTKHTHTLYKYSIRSGIWAERWSLEAWNHANLIIQELTH